MDRLIRVFVRDRNGRLLPQAKVDLYVNDIYLGEAEFAEGSAILQVPEAGTVTVAVSYPGYPEQRETLADKQDSFTFEFPVNGVYSPMRKDMLAALLGLIVVLGLILGAFYLGVLAGVLPLAMGIVLLIVALGLAFTFKEPTVLQAQLIRSTFALAAGALASQIPGLLNVSVSVGTQAAITAGGAIGVYVITFFFTPARDTGSG